MMQLTLLEARKRKGWSLDQLADASGVNRSTINRLERGETKPRLDTAVALEDALGLKRGALLFGQQAVA